MGEFYISLIEGLVEIHLIRSAPSHGAEEVVEDIQKRTGFKKFRRAEAVIGAVKS
jgi:hypothetical protein